MSNGIKGGQGRSSGEVAADGMVLGWLALAAVALVALAIVREVMHG